MTKQGSSDISCLENIHFDDCFKKENGIDASLR